MANKLIFKKVRMKNFRSVCNVWLEVDLNSHPTTMIGSNDNGAGKSTTTLWSLTFALFDTSYGKGHKKPSLVNTRSGKDCVVEVEFETKGSHWLVRRGIKPNIFDIIKDGVRVEDEAATKDYQKYLESVLGMDEKIFFYTIALGPARFVPFAQMGAVDRRNYVEPILDVSIITPMNEITKEKMKLLKKEADQVYYDINILESKLSGHMRTLTVLNEQRRSRLESSSDELAGLYAEQTNNREKIRMIDEKIVELESQMIPSQDDRLQKVVGLLTRFTSKKDSLSLNLKNITSLTTCPTCQQEVTEDHKHSVTTSITTEIDGLVGPIDQLLSERTKIDESNTFNRGIQEKIVNLKNLKIQLNSRLTSIENEIKKTEAKLQDTDEQNRIDEENRFIADISAQVVDKSAILDSLKAKEQEHQVLLGVLKDDGVKAEILKQYIPYLNMKVNQYLDKMNLFVQIEIDDKFDLTMNSPTRKNQTLESLSTGQLRRVDLAVLLAFIEIAKEKSSISTNLLILDEILENLSEQGVSEFMEFWETTFKESDFNLFVITQRNAEFEPFFDDVIKYRLKDEATVIE